MNRSKLIIFKFILLFLTVFLFINCEKDTALDVKKDVFEEAKVSPFSSRLVFTDEIESNTLVSQKLRRLQVDRNNTSIESGGNDFVVDTSIAKYIEKTDGSGYSYTFAINREGIASTEVENLVLSVNTETQKLTTVLFTYHYTTTQLQELLNTGHVSTHTDMTVIPIEGDFSDLLTEFGGQPCTVSSTTYHITPDGGHHVYGQNSQCQHIIDPDSGETECEVYTVTTIWCPPTSTGGSGTSTTTTTTGNPNASSDPSNNTTSGGSTTTANNNPNTNNNNDEDEIVTTPLTKQEINELKQQLDDQFGENGWEFADETLDDEVPSFDSVDELYEYMISQPNNVSVSSSSSSVNQNGDATTRFSFPTTDYLNIANLNIEVVSKTENFATGQEYEVVGIDSYLSGMTIVKKWEPSSNYSVTTSSSNGNFKRILMTGIIRTGTAVAGIDIYIRQIATITLEINKYNGDEGDSEMTLTFF